MKLTSDDIAYLRQAAVRDHYNPDDALKVFSYESSNRPDVWGGKGGKYFGIFQAGPSERAQFGIDTKNPNAKNQIDAFGKFLAARGFKPGMGIMDMYSTVNAGSPGHYKASDGAGTVASHVARMSGSMPAAPVAAVQYAQGEDMGAIPSLIGIRSKALGMAAEDTPQQTIGGLLEELNKEQNKRAGLLGLRAMAQEEEPEDDPAQQVLKEMHQRQHQAALAGLLGGY